MKRAIGRLFDDVLTCILSLILLGAAFYWFAIWLHRAGLSASWQGLL